MTPSDLFDDSGRTAPDPRPGDPVAQVVLVCHANICRSPLGMAMVERQARDRLGASADAWVRSAGVHARPGLAAAEDHAARPPCGGSTCRTTGRPSWSTRTWPAPTWS